MNNTAWITAAFGLLGALIGAASALVSQDMQWRRDRRATGEASRKQAVEDLIVRAMSLSLLAQQMAVVAQEVSSLNGLLNRVLRVFKAFDYDKLFDDLRREGEALDRAAARIWISADQETVGLANAVVMACTRVVDTNTGFKRGTVRARIGDVFRGRRLGDDAERAASLQLLADARRDLVDHTRREFGLPPIDVFALPDESFVSPEGQHEPPARQPLAGQTT